MSAQQENVKQGRDALEIRAAETGGQVRVSLLGWADVRRNVWVGKEN